MVGRVTNWLSTVTGSRYLALLVLMLAIIVVYPFAEANPSIGLLLGLFWLGVVVSALRVIAWGSRTFVVTLTLGVTAMGCSFVAEVLSVGWAVPVGAVLRMLFFPTLIVMILREVLRRPRIDLDAVFGACCAYLLLGMAFASAYALIESTMPGSFDFPAEPAAVTERFGESDHESRLVYFSLITMTTVGYGDITPVSPPAEILSAIEGLIAQLYVAILVARMVGMELADRQPRGS
jgi:hypothetical protein